MKPRVAIPVVLGLIVLAVVGVLQAAGKDHPTAAEGVLFWLSLFALPLLLLLLVALIAIGVRRMFKRDVGADAPR
jgi:uncharacterized membrane protein YhaH (DUF805 family)